MTFSTRLTLLTLPVRVNVMETDVAYLAGLFDGEGCVSVTTHRKGDATYTTRTLVFSQNDKNLCDLFTNILGVGRVYRVARANERRKDHYQWRVNGKDAVRAAFLLLPYLRLKKEQVLSKIGT